MWFITLKAGKRFIQEIYSERKFSWCSFRWVMYQAVKTSTLTWSITYHWMPLRYGTASLCNSQVLGLVSVYRRLLGGQTTPGKVRLSFRLANLLSRLLKFLSPEHQVKAQFLQSNWSIHWSQLPHIVYLPSRLLKFFSPEYQVRAQCLQSFSGLSYL